MNTTRGAVLAALFALLPGCAHLPAAPAVAKAAPESPADSEPEAPRIATAAEQAMSQEERSRLYYHILLAELAEQRGQFDIAYQNYLFAAKASERAELARSAAFAAERGDDPAGSFVASELWQRLAPEDIDSSELLAVGYLRRHQTDQAYALLKTVKDRVLAEHDNLMRELLRVIETEPSAETFQVLSRLADNEPDPDLNLAVAHLALRQHDWTKAEHYADATLKQAPARLDAVRLKVAVLQAQQRGADALAFLQQMRRDQPDNKELLLSSGQMLQRLGKADAARRLYEEHLASHPEDNDVRFALAGLTYDLGDYDASRQAFEAVLAAGLQTSTVYYYLGDIAQRQHDDVRALANFRKVGPGRFYVDARIASAKLLAGAGQIQAARDMLHATAGELPGHGLDMRVAEIDLLREVRQYDDARRVLAQALKDYPGNVQLLLAQAQLASLDDNYALTRQSLEQALGQVDAPEIRKQLILAGSEVLRGAGHAKDAISLVNQGLTTTPKDVDLLYARAILAETLNRPDISEQDLRAILAQQPDNATALNALGYSLADRKIRLAEAADLIAKALAITPNDPAVIDSMGWLHYRRGELGQALQYLRKAYSLNDDPEIAAHLGEVLWQSGDHGAAREIWTKAMEKSPDHQVLKQVVKRFKP